MKTRKTDFGDPQPPVKQTKPKNVQSNLTPINHLPPLPLTSSDRTKDVSEFKPVIHPSILQIKQSNKSNMSSSKDKPDCPLSASEKEDLEEVKDQTKNLTNVTNFEHLAKDGSNFVDWCEETARAIYQTTGIDDYWNSPFPRITNCLLCEQNRAAMTICKNTIDTNL
ncbi:hypothetical protein DFH28DRAFT_1168198 [Melampsora americana]|nr:hypothetical protein DFH28DRAFT_1168198 [Melampsora americana]